MKYAYFAFIPLLLAPDGLLPDEFSAMAQQQNRPGSSQNAKPPGGGGNAAHPPGGGNATRPPSGGGNATRPPSGGNATRPPGGGGNAARPPSGGGNVTRPPGGGNATRPPGGGGNATRPPAAGSNQRPPNNDRLLVVKQPHRPGSGRPSTFRPMHAPSFRYPHGYSYRRWQTRTILPSIFLSSPYLFQDYAMVGVGPPPAGYYWVRYGPDLLLVDRRTRMIVDVIYGAFY